MAEPNTLPPELKHVKGAQALFEWFGYWPTFHDAEVTSVHLNRVGSSSLTVHVWETTDHVNAQGYFAQQKHAVVSFTLFEILELDLKDFNHQNVLASLNLISEHRGYELTLGSIYGLAGRIKALRVEITFVPGEPVEIGSSNDAGRPTRGPARPLTEEERLRVAAENEELRNLQDTENGPDLVP